jgi:putative endonuclease
MTAERQALGVLGERCAERWLVARGWRVLGRRFRSGHRDLDLVVGRGDVVAFVEVKARRGRGRGRGQGQPFGSPVEAVGWRKQRELVRSAQVWVDRHGRGERTYRFDVIGVVFEGSRVLIEHVEDAFRVPSMR